MEFVTSLPVTHLFENLWLPIAKWNLLLNMKLHLRNSDQFYTFKMLCVEFKEEYEEYIHIPEHYVTDSTPNQEYEKWKIKSNEYCGIESLSDLMNDRTKKSAISAKARNNNISFSLMISEIQKWLESYNDTIPPKMIDTLRLVESKKIFSTCKLELDAGLKLLYQMSESEDIYEQRMSLIC